MTRIQLEFAAIRCAIQRTLVVASFVIVSGNLLAASDQETDEVFALEAQAAQGDAVAQNRLAVMLGSGSGVRRDDKLAVAWLKKAAGQKNAAAQFNLGFLYREGRGVPKDLGKAEHWFRKAAEQGDAHAQSNLGVMYSFGQGGSRNDQIAMDHFHKAAKASEDGRSEQHYLGFKFDIGLESPVDYKLAARWYRTSAENYREYPSASNQDDLSKIYLNYLVAPSRPRRIDNGSRTSPVPTDGQEQFELGFKYYSGRYGLPWDYRLALHWFRQAAERGHVAAQFNVGVMYTYGDGAPQDFILAVEWYRKAALQGYARAQSNLGVMYAKGYGVPQDIKEASEWIRRAAENGNVIAQNTLAFMHEIGLGVPQDFKLAVTWYRKAREPGNGNEQYTPGWRDDQVLNLPPDVAQSTDNVHICQLRRMAERNNAGAQLSLAYLYIDGQKIKRDYGKAAYWYRRAIGLGSVQAIGRLAELYSRGDGVPKSKIIAYALTNLASDRTGYAASRNYWAWFAMSAAELEAGQALTRELALPGKFIEVLDRVTSSPPQENLRRATPDGGARPWIPPEELRSCKTHCRDGKCLRTFGDGRQLRFQAKKRWDAKNQRLHWDKGSC